MWFETCSRREFWYNTTTGVSVRYPSRSQAKKSMMYIFRNFQDISDSDAAAGRALQLSASGKMMIAHFYHSIMPGRYEIFWRLRFMNVSSILCELNNRNWSVQFEYWNFELFFSLDGNLEFIAVPQYGLMTRELASSDKFADCLEEYGSNYFRRSMGIITVFQRCTVFVGCVDFSRRQEENNVCIGLYRDDCSGLMACVFDCF